jgi:hypothetical protein
VTAFRHTTNSNYATAHPRLTSKSHITGSGPELEHGETPWYEADNMEQEPEDGAQ